MLRNTLCILFSLALFTGANAQNSSCPNLNFETGTFAGWSAAYGDCCPINVPNIGFLTNRHTIMSGPGFDPYSLNQIPFVPPGAGLYTARLGNDDVNSEAEKLEYIVSVTSQSDLFIYRYAVVLEDPSHAVNEQPRFQISVYDQNGDSIQCGIYNVVASANIPGFQNNGNIRFKPWTTVGIDLSAYHGQNVVVKFMTGDCSLGAHFGYAYIDCYCGPLAIQNAFCPNSVNDTLSAPEGFEHYLWSTGDTTPSIVVPTANVGLIYSVHLTSVTGCTLTLTTTISQTSITAGFIATSFCQNDVHFADTTHGFNAMPVTWLWDFGDSTTATVQNPVHTYLSPGMHDVTLITESNTGCGDTVTNPVLINPTPIGNATVQNTCEGSPSSFLNTSTIAFGNIVSWIWTFSDSTTSNVQSPVHLFNGVGNYSAQLIVTSDLGCIDTSNVTLTITPAPTIDAGPDSTFCGGALVAIGSLSNPAMDYTWTPVTGVTDIHAKNTTVSIPNPAIGSEFYYYFLDAVDVTTGCVSKDSVLIEARATPIAEFQPPPAQCFKGNSFDLAATPAFSSTTYAWYFGAQANPTIVLDPNATGVHYSQIGTFPILLVVDNFGCIDSTTGAVTVVPEPDLDLQVLEEGCSPLSVQFHGTVTPAGPLTYQWNFSDNTSSNDEQPIHVFTIPGTYSVNLRVTNPEGCTDYEQLIDVITVLPMPESRFVTEPSVANIFEPHFEFLNYSKNGYLVSWDFDDGTFSYDSNTAHTYQDTGIYFVQLIMKNSFGCVDTFVSPVEVEPYFSFYVPNAFTPNGDGDNDAFRGLGMYIKTYDMWIYNRWGRIIYYTSDYDKPWDGKGEYDTVAQNEVYEYLIKVTDSKDRPHEFIGHVSLVK